jgi:serine/threonine kinase 16
MAYGHSPFETEGGNVTMAVRSGNYKFPDKDRGYSQGFRDLIKFMLVIEPKNRPDIHAVIERTKHVLSRVQ